MQPLGCHYLARCWAGPGSLPHGIIVHRDVIHDVKTCRPAKRAGATGSLPTGSRGARGPGPRPGARVRRPSPAPSSPPAPPPPHISWAKSCTSGEVVPLTQRPASQPPSGKPISQLLVTWPLFIGILYYTPTLKSKSNATRAHRTQTLFKAGPLLVRRPLSGVWTSAL